MSFYPASIPRCQHIKINGTQCGSPALRRRRFCFFHHQWREQRITLGAKRTARAFDLPVLEDANSIQITLMQVMRLILRGQIDSKSAGLLLYALQTASVNLRNTEFEPRQQTRVVLDPRDVPDTPLGEDPWDPADFEEDDDELEEEEEEEEEDTEENPEGDGSEDDTAEDAENDASSETADTHPHTAKAASTKPADPAANPGSLNPPPSSTPANTPPVGDPSSPGVPKPPRTVWRAPDGSPATPQQAAQLQILTRFIDYIAPLPKGEKD